MRGDTITAAMEYVESGVTKILAWLSYQKVSKFGKQCKRHNAMA